MGFTGLILNWLMNFLTERKQRVVIGKIKSSWVEVLSGVPQGSVLGPLLFLIYINDMPSSVQNILKLFADDSKLIAQIRNQLDLDQVQLDLDSLVKWSNQWSMYFNYKKCKVMKFHKKKIVPILAQWKLALLTDPFT